MWFGGTRVVVCDDKKRILLVCQRHEGKNIWMVPGGGVEEGESSKEGAKREVKEETGLDIKVGKLIWTVEQIKESKEQRFVNYFEGYVEGGELSLGSDPELGEDGRVLCGIKFMDREEIQKLEHVYPESLRDEIWEYFKEEHNHDAYRIRR